MQTVIIHTSERSDSKPNCQYFDGWVEGWQNVVSEPIMIGMRFSDTIAWKARVIDEISAYAWQTGQDVEIRIVNENF